MRTKFYRGGCSSAMPDNKTAKDILNYEQFELGNKDINIIFKGNLKNISAQNLLWVTRTKESAEEYGEANEVYIENFRIIAKDNDDGLLIEILKQEKLCLN